MATILEKDEFVRINDPALIILRVAALGDIVASEPVLRYLRKEYLPCKIIWMIRKEFSEVLIAHPFLDYILFVDNIEEATLLANVLVEKGNGKVISLYFSKVFCVDTKNYIVNNNDPSVSIKTYYFYGSLLEAYTIAARLPRLTDAPMFFLDQNVHVPELPDNFVIFHCLSRDTARNWDPVKWKKLLYFFISNNIDVVEIGFTPVIKSKNPKYHDYTDIRSLQVLAHIIAKTSFFVGIDSGFAHIANALCVNGVIIMGKFGPFTEHVPYTGYYAHDHIVRRYDAKAFEVSVEAVIDYYTTHGKPDLSV